MTSSSIDNAVNTYQQWEQITLSTHQHKKYANEISGAQKEKRQESKTFPTSQESTMAENSVGQLIVPLSILAAN